MFENYVRFNCIYVYDIGNITHIIMVSGMTCNTAANWKISPRSTVLITGYKLLNTAEPSRVQTFSTLATNAYILPEKHQNDQIYYLKLFTTAMVRGYLVATGKVFGYGLDDLDYILGSSRMEIFVHPFMLRLAWDQLSLL